MEITPYDLLPRKEQQRIAEQAARELLSHPMRVKAFLKRCDPDFLKSLSVSVDEALQEVDVLEQERVALLARIEKVADKLGISMDEALQGLNIK